MVALMIVCAHVEGLRPFAVLLSRDGVPDTRRSFDAAERVRPEVRG
jgi:hypothetical protein